MSMHPLCLQILYSSTTTSTATAGKKDDLYSTATPPTTACTTATKPFCIAEGIFHAAAARERGRVGSQVTYSLSGKSLRVAYPYSLYDGCRRRQTTFEPQLTEANPNYPPGLAFGTCKGEMKL